MSCFSTTSRLFLFLLAYAGGALPGWSQPQNLVPNPSFEQYSTCPDGYTSEKLELLSDWLQPALGTSDYYNTCSTGPMRVPNCELGYQQPHSGNGFIGIYAYVISKPQLAYREYMAVKLLQPLKAGVTYQVSFFASLSEVFSLPTDNLGAYLSVDPLTSNDDGPFPNLPHGPQVNNPSGHFLKDRQNWMKIAGEVVAKGGEQYLTLGNFGNDQRTHYLLDDSVTHLYSYYYIDDVSIIGLNQPPLCLESINLGKDTILCSGETLLLQANIKEGEYTWQDGSKAANQAVTKAGAYWVAVKKNGCVYRDTIRVDYQPPMLDLGRDTILCPGQVLTLTASTQGPYLWSDGSTNASLVVTQAGQYWVEAYQHHCLLIDTIRVSFKEPLLELGQDTTLCAGGSILLKAASVKGPYQWSDGSSRSSLVVSHSGKYWLRAFSQGCLVSDTIVVTFNQPFLDLGSDTTVCQGQSLTLSASPASGPYRWSDGSANASLSISQSGQYWVQAFNQGCPVVDTIEVIVELPFWIQLGPDTMLCRGQSIVLKVSLPGKTFLWSNQSTHSSLEVREEGTYWVEASGKSCLARDSIQIRFSDCLEMIPNVITPNGDSQNETWVVEGIQQDRWEVIIVNRWGETVYHSEQYQNNWNGSGLPTGIYSYRLVNLSTQKKYYGWIQILR